MARDGWTQRSRRPSVPALPLATTKYLNWESPRENPPIHRRQDAGERVEIGIFRSCPCLGPPPDRCERPITILQLHVVYSMPRSAKFWFFVGGTLKNGFVGPPVPILTLNSFAENHQWLWWITCPTLSIAQYLGGSP